MFLGAFSQNSVKMTKTLFLGILVIFTDLLPF